MAWSEGIVDWLSTGDCVAAYKFGWLTGVASGLYALILTTLLIMTAPAYRKDRPRVVRESIRRGSQWTLILAQLLLLLAWFLGGFYVGAEDLSCYVISLSFGALSVIAPFVLLFMLTTANWVGRARAQ